MILVCGEALFDVFVAGEDGAGTMALKATPGGSPFNVAIGLARLGRRCGYFGGLSRDLFGARLRRVLAQEKVDTSHCVISDAPTTLAFVEIGGDGAPRYVFRGEGAADRLIASADLPSLETNVRAVTFGSYAAAVSPVGDALLELARREREKRVVVYDPNVRPTVVADLDHWRARFDAFADCAAIVKVSDEDLSLLAPGASVADFAAAAAAQGVSLVVVTRGAEGAAAFGRFGSIAAPAAAAALVDTVGAGDTVTAALIAWLDENGLLSREAIDGLRHDDAEIMLRFAMRAAAATCGRRGADLPRRSDLRD